MKKLLVILSLLVSFGAAAREPLNEIQLMNVKEQLFAESRELKVGDETVSEILSKLTSLKVKCTKMEDTGRNFEFKCQLKALSKTLFFDGTYLGHTTSDPDGYGVNFDTDTFVLK